MRETLVCIGKTGSIPYYFKETGIRVSSYEEICYYVSRHMICYLYTLPEPELASYIGKELGLDQLSYLLGQLNDPNKDQEKYFETLFQEGNYFSAEEVREVLENYRKLKNASVIRQCKMLGDMFLKYNKTAEAIICYDQGLKYTPDNDEERGNLLHNLGAAELRLFHFKNAKINFIKAFQLNKNQESFFWFYASAALENGLDEARKAVRKFEGGDYLASAFEKRFKDLEKYYSETNTAAQVNKIRFAAEHGRDGASAKMAKNFVLKLQDDFRAEQEVGDYLSKMLK